MISRSSKKLVIVFQSQFYRIENESSEIERLIRFDCPIFLFD